MEDVKVIVAHSERATLRAGDVFLKIDADQTRAKVEVEAMAMAPIPTPEILWRMLHDAPLPPWPGRSLDELASRLDGECEWLITNGVLPTDVVTRNRRLAETALRPWTPVFIHGDLQVDHVFVASDEITGVPDWSEASKGDALFDLAILTLEHQEHLGDVVAGYGSPDEFPEVAVLKSRM